MENGKKCTWVFEYCLLSIDEAGGLGGYDGILRLFFAFERKFLALSAKAGNLSAYLLFFQPI